MIEYVWVIKLIISFVLSIIVGWEREKLDKPCGLRTISFITLGGTMVVLMTKKWIDFAMELNFSFDGIRPIAYYLVAIGFVGSGIITSKFDHVEGVTTAALLLPMALVGILVGMDCYLMAIVCIFFIFFILKLKYLTSKYIPEE